MEHLNENEPLSFCEVDSKESTCPICNGIDLEYEGSESRDNNMLYPWKCKRCGSTGEENGSVEFRGHDVDICSVDPQILAVLLDDEERNREAFYAISTLREVQKVYESRTAGDDELLLLGDHFEDALVWLEKRLGLTQETV